MLISSYITELLRVGSGEGCFPQSKNLSVKQYGDSCMHLNDELLLVLGTGQYSTCVLVLQLQGWVTAKCGCTDVLGL